ncbi:MAG TPA: hypothetical protein VGQ57_06975, partial [Polyangiaceae bacterium]|nr:hypothetical protein [Polyangiaceae bacterium]
MIVTRCTLLSLALFGCGSEMSSAAWVREPESSAVIGGAPVALEHESTTNLTVSDAAPSDGPHRLDHTVTLGSVTALPPSDAAPTASNGGPTVIVNVNNDTQAGQQPYYGGYWGGGVGLGAGRGGGAHAAPHSSGGGAPIIPGQSWPAPPSYGPSFPQHTSPAPA